MNERQRQHDALRGLLNALQFCLKREGETRRFHSILEYEDFSEYKQGFQAYKWQAIKQFHDELLNLAKTEYPTPSDWLTAKAEPTLRIDNNVDGKCNTETLVMVPEAARLAAICREIAAAIEPGQKRKISKTEANARARELLKNPAYRTARELAEAIPCSIGLIAKLPAWQAYQNRLRETKNRPAARAATFTPALEATTGRGGDEGLKKLIAEEEAAKRQETIEQLIREQAQDQRTRRLPARRI